MRFLLSIAVLGLLFIHNIKAQDLKGSKERLSIRSKALEGNLIGDPAIRDVSIYLPPDYAAQTDKRYPVIYFLHGFTDGDNKWFGWESHWINLPQIVDSAIIHEVSKEMIIVMPNAYNSFKGSMYSSSVTIGDWEKFVVEELVEWTDKNYRTIATRESRGLAGHSMGGYGTMRLGMKYPGVFGAIYALSPCCMEHTVNTNAGLIKNVQKVTTKEQLEEQPFFVSATLALAAAWAPNPNHAPLYLDVPYTETGEIDPEISAKFMANTTLSMLDQYVYNLKTLNAIGLDAGNQDMGISGATKKLHERLETNHISHDYEAYEGDHLNRIAERIYQKVLPFFTRHLQGQP